MKAYIGTKIVRAEPMGHVQFENEIKHNDIKLAEGCTDEAGYLVEYQDGYRSWSPAAVFEHAYRPITPEEKDMVKQ